MFPGRTGMTASVMGGGHGNSRYDNVNGNGGGDDNGRCGKRTKLMCNAAIVLVVAVVIMIRRWMGTVVNGG